MLKNSIKYIYKQFIPISVIAICLYALYLRIMVLYRHELWADELFSLSQMGGSFLDLLKGLPKVEFCPYLSGDLYLIYPFFKIFSYNKWGLAIPHIIATIIGFYILYLICRRYFKSILAYLITFTLVCFNATLINHATEIRSYAVLPTLALATLYLFLRISDLNFGLNASRKIGSIAFFILVIWFHVYGILMFFSSLLFVLLTEHREKGYRVYFKNSILFASTILCLSMPLWLYSVFGPHFGYSKLNINTFEYFPNPLYNITGFLKTLFCNLAGYKNIYFLLLGLIIPVIFRYKDRYRQLLFLSCSVIAPICLILLFDLLGKYWFLQRQFIWIIPLFAFFLGWTWDSFFILFGNSSKNRSMSK